MTSSVEIDIHANVQQNYSYKLMELSPALLAVIEENRETLQIKAPKDDSEIVMCTADQTFGIRQRNHSNTVMVMKQQTVHERTHYCGYSTMSSVFEVKKVKGTIRTAEIPIYDGQGSISNIDELMKLDDLKRVSAISDMEFDPLWFQLNGSSLYGIAVILSDEIITRTLHVMIMSIMAASLNFEELSLIEVYKSMEDDPDFTIDVVETVLRKFTTGDIEPFSLDKTLVAQWYGMESLKRNCRGKPIDLSGFLIKWKSELPPFFECPLDIPLLSGHYVMPLPERIQYMSKLELPGDIKNRLKYLFRMQAIWKLEDLVPFIEEFNTKGVKNENFIMKFAKRKKQGKSIIITQR